MRSANPRVIVRRRSSMAIACCLALSACVDQDVGADELDEEERAELEEEFRVQWGAMANHFTIVQDDSVASKATGSIEVLMRNANGTVQTFGGHDVRGTCGVTFVSPHYAITAAHCVDNVNVPNPATNTLPVTTYDVSAVNPWDFLVSSFVNGSYPNYVPLAETEDLNGYQSQQYSCTVVSRCDFGAHNCNFVADIAMLYCPTRAGNAPWLPIAPSDPQTGNVEMYWFHELLSMPTAPPPAGAPLSERDRWDHYGVWSSNHANNSHYLDISANGILPLKSIPWPGSQGGVQRRRIGNNWTDLYGCHGTSGSGVLQRNTLNNLELLGPVRSGESGWALSRLCNNPSMMQPGQASISYTSNASTRQLQTNYSFALMWDRNPIVWNPPSPPVFDPG